MKTNEIKIGMRVECGEDDDHDTGVVDSVNGASAIVRWESGVTTPAPIILLRAVGNWRNGPFEA